MYFMCSKFSALYILAGATNKSKNVCIELCLACVKRKFRINLNNNFSYCLYENNETVLFFSSSFIFVFNPYVFILKQSGEGNSHFWVCIQRLYVVCI